MSEPAAEQQRPKQGQKTALITGAGAGGIGGALATEFHHKGYFVFCAVRRPETVKDILQPGMVCIKMDVTSTESVAAAADQVADIASGSLDVLVNNAGSATHVPALDLDVDGVVAGMMDVNVLGPMRVVKAFAKQLMAAKGCVVNIGSIAPILPLAYSSGYNASKAAIHAYGDSLRMELKPFGVDVVTAVTGGVKSNIVKESNPSLPKDSLYIPVQKFWRDRTQASQGPGSMETDQYARRIVDMITTRNRPTWFWAGGRTFFAWIFHLVVPRRARLFFIARRFGLNQLGRS